MKREEQETMQREEQIRQWRIEQQPIVTALQMMFYMMVIVAAIKYLFA